jgi:arylsulfatase A-like enzyme
MAKYYQQIYAIDQAVGMIRDALHKYGEDRNTVIIYTSDNGFMNGSHGYGSKVIPYEESSRVPLIIYDPRHPNSGKALECHSLTGNVDFHPTILKLAGVPLPPRVDGRSLLPLYADPRAETHPYLPLINVWGPEEVFSFGVVSQDWKYIFWPYDAGDFVKTEEMYHLATDRLEMHALSKDPEYANQLKTMRKAYDRALEHWRDEAVPYHNYQPFAEVFSR